MKTSKNGLDLIKEFEGCYTQAYQDAVGIWTIGYGLTNADRSVTGLTVKKGVKITKKEAVEWLPVVLARLYEPKVNKYMGRYNFSQNEYDALVSFCFNIGNIDGLTHDGNRTKKEIAEMMLKYNKAGGKVLTGLVRRRKAEQELFLKKEGYSGKFPTFPKRGYYKNGDGIHTLTSYQTQIKRVQRVVNWVMDFNLEVDGMYGDKTQKAVKRMQKRFGLDPNGCYGLKCQRKAKAYKK